MDIVQEMPPSPPLTSSDLYSLSDVVSNEAPPLPVQHDDDSYSPNKLELKDAEDVEQLLPPTEQGNELELLDNNPVSSIEATWRAGTSARRKAPRLPPRDAHEAALHSIMCFLKSHTAYDAFPISSRLIVLDTKLNAKKALQCLLLNGIVSASLWNSDKSVYAGMLTVLDFIRLIQYYHRTTNYADAALDVETFRLESLHDVEKELGVEPPPLISEHPDSTLHEAAKKLIQTHASRLPLLDKDTTTGHEFLVSVLSQYRLLKFISINCQNEVLRLHKSLRSLKIGTFVSRDRDPEDRFYPIATATLDTPVFDVVRMFSERSISAVPIINEEGVVVNLYETVDVITLVRLGVYQSLDLKISEALKQRSPDFPGVVVCSRSDSVGKFLQLLRIRRVYRLVVVEGEEEERKGGKKGRLLGIITLSDILRYLIGVSSV